MDQRIRRNRNVGTAVDTKEVALVQDFRAGVS